MQILLLTCVVIISLPKGNPVYPYTYFVELPSDDPVVLHPVLFSVDRVGESRQFIHDFLCPQTLKMMIIVHNIRAQIACHGPSYRTY